MRPHVIFAVLLGGTLVACGVAIALLEPLSSAGSPLYGIPPLGLGLYLVVSATWIRDQGLYGELFGGLPGPGHVALCALGFALAGGAVVFFAKLPPAGAGRIQVTLPRLEALCVGEPDVRLEREVLPMVDALLDLREAQGTALRGDLDAAIRELMARCAGQARGAFADPAGTHGSWRKLRRWMRSHPELAGIDARDPLWTLEYRPRREAPRETPSGPVLLE